MSYIMLVTPFSPILLVVYNSKYDPVSRGYQISSHYITMHIQFDFDISNTADMSK